MAESSTVRVVRCPKCDSLLSELPDYSVYQIGGCGVLLRGMKQAPVSDEMSERGRGDGLDGLTTVENLENVLRKFLRKFLRKLDELKDQLSRSCGTTEKTKERVTGDRRRVLPLPDPHGGHDAFMTGGSTSSYNANMGPPAREKHVPKPPYFQGPVSYVKNHSLDMQDFSRQSTENGRSNVFVNGQLIPERVVKKAEKLAGPIQPGEYWYDFRAGFWGVIGQYCLGIIPPFIEEFNYPMPENCCAGNTGVFVNGRELHQRDLVLLSSRGLPLTRDKSYIIEISGRVIDEDTSQELDSLGKLAPTVEKAKHGFGMKVPRAISSRSWLVAGAAV